MNDEQPLVQWSYDCAETDEATESESDLPTKPSSFRWRSKIAIAVILLTGISTAVVAQTAPELLEPLVTIPEALLSGNSASPVDC